MKIVGAQVSNRVLDSCESTNDLARELGEQGFPQGTWVSSRIQTRGRGRLGRTWQSMPGSLFLSMLARIPDPTLWSWIPLTAAVAVCETLTAHGFSGEVRIKWPNDIFLAGSKAGGILCEGLSGPSGQFVVIGLGLNCMHSPKGLDQPTAFFGIEDVDAFRLRVVDFLKLKLLELEVSGPAGIREAYEKLAWFPVGTQVQWGNHFGEVVGLGGSGELQVREQPMGEIRSLFAEDVKIRQLCS